VVVGWGVGRGGVGVVRVWGEGAGGGGRGCEH
jgi:hypothetical protein